MGIKLIVLENIEDKEKRHATIQTKVREVLNNKELVIEYLPKGKPVIKNYEPQKYISVTTTGSKIIIAISDLEVGIDGEELSRFIDSKTDYIALAERFFSEEEADYVRDGEGDNMRFVKIWVRKEAYTKFTGKGLVDFPNFTVNDGERFMSKVNGVPLRKINVPGLENDNYLFIVAGAE